MRLRWVNARYKLAIRPLAGALPMIMSTFYRYAAVASMCGVLVLVGCSQQSSAPAPSPAQSQAQTQNEAASQQLATYRKLLSIKNDSMTVTAGEDIVQRFPESDAAKEVQQTLPAVEARWKENSEKNRLAGLWLYQTSPMEGGTQSTATIYSSSPAGDRAIRLVLRRHTVWGQGVFLYSGGHGFVCKGNCLIAAKFDGKPHPIRAFLPTTGEPAIFIRDDKPFIAALEKAKKITMDVEMQDSTGKQTLLYEVGGFDPSKWVDVGKDAGKKGKK
jgi:hypothetical protein